MVVVGTADFYELDIDALYARVIAAGYRPEAAPRDAEWVSDFSFNRSGRP